MAEKFASHLHLKRGKLMGWHATQSAATRHRHLAEAVRRNGRGTVIRELNVLHTLDKNKAPSVARVAEADERWVRRTYEDEDREARREA